MRNQLFAACALAGLIAVPAMAQVTGGVALPAPVSFTIERAEEAARP